MWIEVIDSSNQKLKTYRSLIGYGGFPSSSYLEKFDYVPSHHEMPKKTPWWSNQPLWITGSVQRMSDWICRKAAWLSLFNTLNGSVSKCAPNKKRNTALRSTEAANIFNQVLPPFIMWITFSHRPWNVESLFEEFELYAAGRFKRCPAPLQSLEQPQLAPAWFRIVSEVDRMDKVVNQKHQSLVMIWICRYIHTYIL